MRAYKGFKLNKNNKLVCRDFVFEVGKEYEISGKLELCKNGFHFCWNINDVDDYYTLNDSIICEVQILGEVINETDMTKSCTNKIKIEKILTKEDVLRLSNSGNGNSGNRNSGNWNSGNRNSGNWNSGNRNSGNRNSGYWNSGNWNSGNRNSGNWNSGNWNSGNGNSGDWNSGNWNSGNWNSGDWNSGNWNSGYWNTNSPYIRLFNRETNITFDDFFESEYYNALTNGVFIPTEWVEYTEEEKKSDISKELIGGYLKRYEYKEACNNWWDSLSDEDKITIQNIPNFDKDIFFEITGIKL